MYDLPELRLAHFVKKDVNLEAIRHLLNEVLMLTLAKVAYMILSSADYQAITVESAQYMDPVPGDYTTLRLKKLLGVSVLPPDPRLPKGDVIFLYIDW